MRYFLELRITHLILKIAKLTFKLHIEKAQEKTFFFMYDTPREF